MVNANCRATCPSINKRQMSLRHLYYKEYGDGKVREDE